MRNNVSCAGSFVHFRNKGVPASRVKTVYTKPTLVLENDR